MPMLPLPTLEDAFLVSRGGSGIATYTDSLGVVQLAAANSPRVDYALGTSTGRYNAIRNPHVIGAVVGTPGVMPTYWSTSWHNGVTPTGFPVRVQFVGVDDGMPSFDIWMTGTPNVSCAITVWLDDAVLEASQGQQFRLSVYRRSVSSVPPSGVLGCAEYDADGVFLGESTTAMTIPSALLSTARAGHTHTVVAAGTARIRPFMRVPFVGGTTYDVRWRLGRPMLEAGSVSTDFLGPPLTTMMRREWEFTGGGYRGLLLEDARTNYWTNPRGLGAVVGGAFPTGWSVSGFTSGAVVEVGDESGLPFVGLDLGSNAGVVGVISPSLIQVTEGVTFTFSFYCRLAALTVAGAAMQITMLWRNAANQTLQQDLVSITPNSGPLRAQRFTFTQVAPAGATNVIPRVRFGASSNWRAILQFGGFQVEAGDRATSPILNPVGVTTVVSRGRDRLSSPSLQINGDSQTLYAKVLLPGAEKKRRGILQVSDAAGWNRTLVAVEPSGTVVAQRTTLVGTVGDGRRVVMGSAIYGTPFTVQLAADKGSLSASFNGGGEQSAVAPTGLPTSTLNLGANIPLQGFMVGQLDNEDSTALNGWLQEFAIINHRHGQSRLLEAGRLAPTVAFTRSQSGRTLTLGQDGVTWVSGSVANIPRFSGTGRRLLMEGGRSNEIQSPNDFSTWSPIFSGVGATAPVLTPDYSAIAAPDGSFTATRLQADAGTSGWSGLTLNVTSNASKAVWVRTLSGTATLQIGTSSTTVGDQRTVNTTWQRITAPTSGSIHRILALTTVAGNTQVVDLLIWGASSEPGATFPSTLILPSSAPAVSTRGSELARASLADLGIGPNGACTVLLTAMLGQSTTAAFQTLAVVDAGNTTTTARLLNTNGATPMYLGVRTGGGESYTLLGNMTPGALLRYGMTLDGNGRMAACMEGGAVAVNTGAPFAGLLNLGLGSLSGGSQSMFGELGTVIVYSWPFSDAELQAACAAL